jgi:hypothetical protein
MAGSGPLTTITRLLIRGGAECLLVNSCRCDGEIGNKGTGREPICLTYKGSRLVGKAFLFGRLIILTQLGRHMRLAIVFRKDNPRMRVPFELRRIVIAFLLALALLFGGLSGYASVQRDSHTTASHSSHLIADCGGSVGTHC